MMYRGHMLKTLTTLFLLALTSPQAFASATRVITADSVKSSDLTKTYSLPSATDTLVGRASTDTLTNKTISGASNTITGLTVAQLTPAAQAISASNIDWSAGSVFTKTLGANTTLTFSNQTSGQTIVVRLTNTASNYTVAWPGTVKWPGGTAPTQTTGAKADVITCVYDGSDTYCNSVQNF